MVSRIFVLDQRELGPRVLELGRQLGAAIVAVHFGAQRVYFLAFGHHVGVCGAVARRDLREFRFEHLEAVGWPEYAFAGGRIHQRIRLLLRKFGFQIDGLLFQRRNLVIDLPHVVLGAIAHLEIDILQLRQQVVVLLFELGQTVFNVGDLLAEFFGFVGEEVQGLGRGLLTLAQVLVQEQADDFVGHSLRGLRPLALVREIESDSRLHGAPLLGVNHVGADRRDGNVFTHVLDHRFQRLAAAILGVQVVLLDNPAQIRVGQHALRNHLDTLVGEAGHHRAHEILRHLLLLDQNHRARLVDRR